MLSDDLYNLLRPAGSIIPRLYGLPKIHKTGVPVRPVLSMKGSAAHKVAHWLKSVLDPVVLHFCKYNIKDTFELVSTLKNIKVKSTELYLASLDAVSLFTSVPVERCLGIIREFLGNDKVAGVCGEELIELIGMCVCNVQFLFNGIFYRQTDGVAMGSPLGPILADIFVGFIESQVDIGLRADVVFYGRYVDDVLLISKSANEVGDLRQLLNSIDGGVQFTEEHENDNALPFLDVLVTRELTCLSFGWHHKETWTGQYLHYLSFVPLHWKTGLLKGLKTRILKICSPHLLEKAIDEISVALFSNGYPKEFALEHFINFLPLKRFTTVTVPKKNIYLQLPFLGDEVSASLHCRLNRAIQTVYPCVRVISRFVTTRSFYIATRTEYLMLCCLVLFISSIANAKAFILGVRKGGLATASSSMFQSG